MYQFEVLGDGDLNSIISIPEEVLQEFSKGEAFINNCVRYSVLQWEEHCTECAMPACYQTCDLYRARRDGHCRRFVNGMVPIHLPELNSPLVQVDFKRWGAMMSSGCVGVLNRDDAEKIQAKASKAEWIARRGTLTDQISFRGRKGIIARLATRYKKSIVEKSQPIELADAFCMQVYSEIPVDLSLVIRAKQGNEKRPPYQKRIVLSAGYHQVLIPFDEIAPYIDYPNLHFINITPNRTDDSDSDPITFVFGFVGFIQQGYHLKNAGNESQGRDKSVKVMVWDLDNTLWDGILVEDGEEGVNLKEGIRNVIETLDKRGIVNSIASKNDHQKAWRKLESLGLSHYFVFPQINWDPKSQNIRRISEDFNVGLDSIAFIDDSAFERSEVKRSLKSVRVFEHDQYMSLLNMRDFNPSVSSESSSRRDFYISQHKRSSTLTDFNGSYFEFIKESEINLSIGRADINNIDRVHELIQRTNQMNFSATRYDRERLMNLLQDDLMLPLYLMARDKFGDYGTVGFCLIDITKHTVTDLMFSCRVQSKRVEHAFIYYLLDLCRQAAWHSLKVEYLPTERNRQTAKVFQDLSFKKVDGADRITIWEKETTKPIEGEGLIEISSNGISLASINKS